MNKILFHKDALSDYNWHSDNDKKLFNRLQKLIFEILRTPYVGTGKPEKLKGDLSGYWSRRLNKEHRIVYRVEEDYIVIISCRFHYKK